MQTNILITSTDQQGKKKTKTLSYVNPVASNNSLLQMAQAINALTTNTFVMASKETKGEVL